MSWLSTRKADLADTQDENGLVYLWLKSYAQSRYGRSIGASVSGSDEEISYWKQESPRVLQHLLMDSTTIACDSKDPSLIYGFVCMSTAIATIHAFVVKHRWIKGGFGLEFVQALLGDLVDKKCAYTSELPDLYRIFRDAEITGKRGTTLATPPDWYLDATYYYRYSKLMRAEVHGA